MLTCKKLTHFSCFKKLYLSIICIQKSAYKNVQLEEGHKANLPIQSDPSLINKQKISCPPEAPLPQTSLKSKSSTLKFCNTSFLLSFLFDIFHRLFIVLYCGLYFVFTYWVIRLNTLSYLNYHCIIPFVLWAWTYLLTIFFKLGHLLFLICNSGLYILHIGPILDINRYFHPLSFLPILFKVCVHIYACLCFL